MTDATTKFSASASHIAMIGRPFGAPRIHMDEAAAGGAPATFDSPSSAAAYWAGVRDKQPAANAADPETPAADAGAADSAAASGDDNELPDEGNAARADAPDPGEDDGADPEAEKLPPIARPKSWAKEEDAEWAGLPRSLQEKIAARETAREKAIRQSQNDAAEKSKAVTAKEQAAEQARAHFEAQAKQALAILEREQLSEFPDIRTTADVKNLALTDPLRFNAWQAHQAEIAWAAEQAREAEERTTKAMAEEWSAFRNAENAKAIEHIPDLGDAKKATAIMEKAVTLLQEFGFTPQELNAYDKGEKISLFDHRVQRLLVDAIRYQDMQKAKAAAVTKPVPHVQRPGARQPSGAAQTERVQALNTRLTNSGDIKDAVALRIAQRAAARR